MAPKSILTATPASNSVITGILPWRIDKKTVKATAHTAPAKANAGITNMLSAVKPKAMEKTAPVAAPLDTPIMPGSASGLPKIPCITPPAIPKAAPTSIPTSIRGILIYQMTAICSCVKSLLSKKGNPS